MGAIVDFVCFVVSALLTAAMWAVILYVLSTWLLQFNVINMRNRVVYSIVHALDAVSRPLLRPIRRMVPPIGGMLDLSPFLLLVLIVGFLDYLLPAFQGWLHSLIGA